MEENKKKIIISLLLLTMVIVTGTFAWYVWSSKDNTNMNVTIGELADVTFKTGNDISISNLSPSFNYDDGVVTEFSIKKKNGVTDELNSNIYLNITSIDSSLKDSSFKYILLSSSDNSNYSEVSSGNFSSANTGKFNIVDSTPLSDGRTYYKFYIWIDGNSENSNSIQGKSLKGTLNVEVSTPSVNAVTLVNSLDDGTTGDSGSGVYKVTHDAIASSNSATGSEIPAVTDYRYYGASPNNYICLDNSGGTCEDRHLYRIIGSIYEENAGQNLIKVIKATPLTDGTTSEFSWDYTSSGSYSNIWANITSGNYSNSLTSGASLMKLLNSGDWWNRTNTYANYGLTEKVKSYIATSRYYLGGYSYSNSEYTNSFYAYERGTTRLNANRPLYWDGYVGLMYPSDYGYAAGKACVDGTNLVNYDSSCKSKDWLLNSSNWQWLISPSTDNSGNGWYVDDDGTVSSGSINRTGLVAPVFYLNSSASISSGDGTSSAPYILS